MPALKLSRTNRIPRTLWLMAMMTGLFCLFPAPARATEKSILIIESSRLRPYETVALNFIEELSKSMVAGRAFTIRGFNYHRVVLTEAKSSIPSGDMKADLILAIGPRAFKIAARGEVPVIYTLVTRPERINADRNLVTGVSMRLDPAKQLDALLELFPRVKKIGVIYSRRNSMNMVTAGRKHLENRAAIVAIAAEKARDLPAGLDSLAKVDALWMLPDPLLVTPETMEKTMLFSLEHKIPVLAFAPKYLKTGAAVAVGFDIAAIGRQAATMANAVLNGTPVAEIRPEMPRHKTSVNRRVINQLKRWRADADRTGHKPAPVTSGNGADARRQIR